MDKPPFYLSLYQVISLFVLIQSINCQFMPNQNRILNQNIVSSTYRYRLPFYHRRLINQRQVQVKYKGSDKFEESFIIPHPDSTAPIFNNLHYAGLREISNGEYLYISLIYFIRLAMQLMLNLNSVPWDILVFLERTIQTQDSKSSTVRALL